MGSTLAKFAAEKLLKYPHMFPLDIAIWERFLDSHSSMFSGVDYDIKVGSGTTVPEGTPENYRRMQEILSKYRIDCIGYDSNTIYIIEVKPEAGTVAIGQIIAYTTLYKRDFKPTKKVVGMIITDRELPDMKHLADVHGILYFIV